MVFVVVPYSDGMAASGRGGCQQRRCECSSERKRGNALDVMLRHPTQKSKHIRNHRNRKRPKRKLVTDSLILPVAQRQKHLVKPQTAEFVLWCEPGTRTEVEHDVWQLGEEGFFGGDFEEGDGEGGDVARLIVYF